MTDDFQKRTVAELVAKLNKPEELAALTDAELTLVASETHASTLQLCQFLASLQDDFEATRRLIVDTLNLGQVEKMRLAQNALKRGKRGKIPSRRQVAALVACSFSDEEHISSEMQRRQSGGGNVDALH